MKIDFMTLNFINFGIFILYSKVKVKRWVENLGARVLVLKVDFEGS